METHPDEFQRAQRLETPIGVLEQEARDADPNTLFKHRMGRGKNFAPDTDTPTYWLRVTRGRARR